MFGNSQRPLKRRVIKLASTLLGPHWAHAHTWLPSLRFEKDEAGAARTVFYRKKRIAELLPPDALAQQAGERVYIIGTGPSLAQNDLTLLEPRSCLLLNGAISEIGRQVETPLAVVIEDERFVWRHHSMLKDRIAPGTLCCFSVGVIRALCEKDPEWLQSVSLVLIDDIRKPYGAPRRSFQELRARPGILLNEAMTAGVSERPQNGVFQGGSVVISALQLAMYAHPKLIGLAGIDILNANRPRFYEQAHDTAPSGLQRAQKRIGDHLQLAVEACQARGIEVHNYSPESILAHCGLAYDARLAKRV